MSAYRAYMARPTTPEPRWDWAQTIIANNAEDAKARAYTTWVLSKPQPAPPPLADCRVLIQQVGLGETSDSQENAGNPESEG